MNIECLCISRHLITATNLPRQDLYLLSVHQTAQSGHWSPTLAHYCWSEGRFKETFLGVLGIPSHGPGTKPDLEIFSLQSNSIFNTRPRTIFLASILSVRLNIHKSGIFQAWCPGRRTDHVQFQAWLHQLPMELQAPPAGKASRTRQLLSALQTHCLVLIPPPTSLPRHRLTRVQRVREGKIIEAERKRRTVGSHSCQVPRKVVEKLQDQIAIHKSLRILLLRVRRFTDWGNQADAI